MSDSNINNKSDENLKIFNSKKIKEGDGSKEI